ncbi:MAG: RHS repeat-associated core domain-containing protein [Acidobacteriaceae bacterium]
MDWEGSSRLATTWATGQVYSATSYAPFGEPYNQSGSSDVSFTGQDPDTTGGSPGQDDFLFRRLDPVAGRWTQPDPAGWAAVDITNPH